MDQELRTLFERALDGEPAQPVDPVRAAMAAGTRLRRRRRLLAGGAATGVAAALVAVVGLSLPGGASVVDTAAQGGKGCTAADWAVVQLDTDARDSQRAAIRSSLDHDPAVRLVRYQSRSEVFERVKVLWKDDPDKIKQAMAESFVVQLTAPARLGELSAEARNWPGVADVVQAPCVLTGTDW